MHIELLDPVAVVLVVCLLIGVGSEKCGQCMMTGVGFAFLSIDDMSAHSRESSLRSAGATPARVVPTLENT